MSKNEDLVPENLPTKVNQLICFALHSTNNAMNRAYKPLLAPLGLTYPQYITLVALWERDGVTVGDLCERLFTETSTLTPVLKRLELQGHVQRKRSQKDERKVFIHLTDSGLALQAQSPAITSCIIENTNIQLAQLDTMVEQLTAMRAALTAGK